MVPPAWIWVKFAGEKDSQSGSGFESQKLQPRFGGSGDPGLPWASMSDAKMMSAHVDEARRSPECHILRAHCRVESRRIVLRNPNLHPLTRLRRSADREKTVMDVCDWRPTISSAWGLLDRSWKMVGL